MSNAARDLYIREALPTEAAALSELALRSKAHWGYPDDFMEACRDELSIDATIIGTTDFRCFVAEGAEGIVGFYALVPLSDTAHELEALFVEPAAIGQGVGRRLMQHAKKELQNAGARRMVIQGDPNATAFYLAAGAVKTGERASGSIPGRYLPVFEIELE